MSTPVILHPEPHRRPTGDTGRFLVGLVVVALGVLFLLDGADVLDAGTAISDWWPAAIVMLGALQLLERPRPTLSAALLILAGGVLLLFTTDVAGDSAWDLIWPAAVVAIGLAILTRSFGRDTAEAVDDDTVVATGIFGGPSVASASASFRRASLTAIFGGVTLDLRRARPAADGGATVNATAVFGGVDILVPRGWRITTRGTPLFGGVEDKTDPTAEVPPDAPELHVDALAIFGGVDIKHGKG